MRQTTTMTRRDRRTEVEEWVLARSARPWLLGAAFLLVAALASVGPWSGTAISAEDQTGEAASTLAVSPTSDSSAVVPELSAPRVRDPSGRSRHSDRFPNPLLVTHDERSVRFYDDLVKDRIVVVNFMYSSCENICLPIAQNLGRVHELLGERMGREILFLSLTIDSKVDDSAALRHYIEVNGGEKKGWIYLTGDYDEIDQVRRSLGVYDLDPVIDADKAEHSGLITFGNDYTDRWAALPALMNSEEIVETVLRITRETQPRSSGAGS